MAGGSWGNDRLETTYREARAVARQPDITIYTELQYTDAQMASKTISLKEETYDRLARAKGDEESFSDVIDRLLRARETEHPLYELVGLCSETELEALRTRSHAFREDVGDRMGRPT